MSAPFPVRVQVDSLRAEGLRAADSNGFSDPFAVVKVGKERFETEVKHKTLDPNWEGAAFVFGVKQDLTQFDAIKVTLWDKDLIGRDRLGEVEIGLAELWDRGGEPIEGWRPVYYSGTERGR